jgi:hypothetical protein
MGPATTVASKCDCLAPLGSDVPLTLVSDQWSKIRVHLACASAGLRPIRNYCHMRSLAGRDLRLRIVVLPNPHSHSPAEISLP